MDEKHFHALLQDVERYSSYGWTCLPLVGKRPLIGWTTYQFKSATTEEQLAHFHEHKQYVTGVGILTGLTHKLAVLDLEEGEDFDRFNIPEGCPTARSGGNGRHFYFRFPDELTIDHNKGPLGKYGIKGDILLNCGLITASPSIHPDTGQMYEWIVEPTGAELPDMPRELLNLLLSGKNADKKTDWSSTELISVPEGMRHSTALSVAGKLVQQTPESDWQDFALPQLFAWNLGACEPPMEADEVLSIFNSVCNLQTAQRTNMIRVPTLHTRPTKTLSLNDLYLLPEEEMPTFLIDKIVPENGITYLYGQPGSGKSMVMLEMVRAIAGGTRFLDKFETVQKNILIVDEENDQWEQRRRAMLLGIDKDLPIYFNCLHGFKFDHPQTVTNLIKLCKDKQIHFVVYDPFVSLHSSDENNATEMQKIMEVMQQFINENITVMFIHHSRKGGYGSGAQNTRGSSAINGRADSALQIDNTKQDDMELIDIRHTKSRRGKSISSLRTVLSQPVENGPIYLTYDGDTSEALVKKDQAKDVILDLLKENTFTRKNLIDSVVELTRIGYRNVGIAIKELEAETKITFSKNGREKEYSLFQVPVEIDE